MAVLAAAGAAAVVAGSELAGSKNAELLKLLESTRAKFPELELKNEVTGFTLLSRAGRLSFSYPVTVENQDGEAISLPLQLAVDYQYIFSPGGVKGTFIKAADYGNVELPNFEGDFKTSTSELQTVQVRFDPWDDPDSGSNRLKLGKSILDVSTETSGKPEVAFSSEKVKCRGCISKGDKKIDTDIQNLRLSGIPAPDQPLKFSEVQLAFNSMTVDIWHVLKEPASGDAAPPRELAVTPEGAQPPENNELPESSQPLENSLLPQSPLPPEIDVLQKSVQPLENAVTPESAPPPEIDEPRESAQSFEHAALPQSAPSPGNAELPESAPYLEMTPEMQSSPAAAVLVSSYTISGLEHLMGIRDVDNDGLGVLYARGTIGSIKENPGTGSAGKILPGFSNSGYDFSVEKIDTRVLAALLDQQSRGTGIRGKLRQLCSKEVKVDLTTLHTEINSEPFDAAGTLTFNTKYPAQSARTEVRLAASKKMLKSLVVDWQHLPEALLQVQLAGFAAAGYLTSRDGSYETTVSLREGRIFLNGKPFNFM